MRILLVAATTFEIRPLLGRFTFLGKQSAQLSQFHYKDLEIDVLVPGIGMIPTAFFLGRQLAGPPYDLAINAGIAGAFDRSLPMGSVVNVTEDCVPELGAEDAEKFLSVFDLGLADPDAPPYHGGKLVNETHDSGVLRDNDAISNLRKVKAITSNTVRGNAASIARILRLSEADIESMEGAAFFYACLSANIPCLQIRAISNLVEVRDKSQWNLELALKNLNQVLWEILTFPYAAG